MPKMTKLVHQSVVAVAGSWLLLAPLPMLQRNQGLEGRTATTTGLMLGGSF